MYSFIKNISFSLSIYMKIVFLQVNVQDMKVLIIDLQAQINADTKHKKKSKEVYLQNRLYTNSRA